MAYSSPMVKRWMGAEVLVATLLVGAFFLAPVVAYTKSFALPDAIEPEANHVCSEQVFGTPSPPAAVVSIFPGNTTLEAEWTAFNNCVFQDLYPPYNLTEYATLAYKLFGVGPNPFPARYFFSQGNYSGLVYFDGEKITAAYEFFLQNVTLDTGKTFELLNASMVLTGYGDIEFTASVKNIDTSPIQQLFVGTSGLPGPYSLENTSRAGLTWTLVPPLGVCSSYLQPGATCTASYEVLATNSTQYHYFVYVEGYAGGRPFFYREELRQPAPQAGLGKDWVSVFIGRINGERQGLSLTENATLDRFAAERFATASSNPQISDYGYATDMTSFFGAGASTSGVTELLLYPGVSAPYSYASDLEGMAPRHFAALMNSNYTQYGYYIGRAPYYLISASCPVQEIPSANINVTQYFEGHGCTVTPVPDVDWLVMILAP